MKKFYCGLAASAISLLYSNAHSQDYGAQIDALQNELLKMKQEMNKGTNNKAFFKKGKGLSIESSDGKYSCLLYTSPSPRDTEVSRMPSSA